MNSFYDPLKTIVEDDLSANLTLGLLHACPSTDLNTGNGQSGD